MKNANKPWNNMKHYIIMFLTIPVLYSCFDLDEVPYTSLSPNNFYKDSKELEMGVRSTYRGLRDMLGDRYYGCLEVATEFGSPTNTKWEYPKTNFWIDINNPDISYGEGIDMNQEEKEQKYGEVRFLRAYANYILVRLYGALPIPENYTNGLDGLKIPRKTIEENYTQIIEDLIYAIEKLPLKSQYGKDEIWKISKGAAQALLGDVYLKRMHGK